MKKIIIISILLISIITLLPQNIYSSKYQDERYYTSAEIVKIELKSIDNPQGIKLLETNIHLLVLKGKFKGVTKIAVFRGEDDQPKIMAYKKGQKVLISITKEYILFLEN